MITSVLFLTTQLVCPSIAQLTQAASPDVPAILNAVHESRMRIERGSFAYELSGRDHSRVYHSRWSVAFDSDGERMRAETDSPNVVPSRGGVFSMCENCLLPNSVVTFCTPGEDSRTNSLSVYGLGELPPIIAYAPPPRWVGSFAGAYLWSMYHHPDATWKSIEKARESLVERDADQEKQWQVKWKTPGHDYEAIIAPDRNYSILSLTGSFKQGGVAYRDEVVNTYAAPHNNVWYPVEVAFRRFESDELVAEERLRAEVYSINEPLDPDAFDVSTIKGLAPGTPVAWSTMSLEASDESGHLMWDGTRMTPSVERNTASRGASKSTRIIIIGVNLLLIAVIALVWRRRPRPSVAEQHQ